MSVISNTQKKPGKSAALYQKENRLFLPRWKKICGKQMASIWAEDGSILALFGSMQAMPTIVT